MTEEEQAAVTALKQELKAVQRVVSERDIALQTMGTEMSELKRVIGVMDKREALLLEIDKDAKAALKFLQWLERRAPVCVQVEAPVYVAGNPQQRSFRVAINTDVQGEGFAMVGLGATVPVAIQNALNNALAKIKAKLEQALRDLE